MSCVRLLFLALLLAVFAGKDAHAAPSERAPAPILRAPGARPASGLFAPGARQRTRRGGSHSEGPRLPQGRRRFVTARRSRRTLLAAAEMPAPPRRAARARARRPRPRALAAASARGAPPDDPPPRERLGAKARASSSDPVQGADPCPER